MCIRDRPYEAAVEAGVGSVMASFNEVDGVPATANSQPWLNSKHSINNLNSEYYIEDGSFFRIRCV